MCMLILPVLAIFPLKGLVATSFPIVIFSPAEPDSKPACTKMGFQRWTSVINWGILQVYKSTVFCTLNTQEHFNNHTRILFLRELRGPGAEF